MLKKRKYIVFIITLLGLITYMITGMLLVLNKPIKSSYILLEGWASSITIESVAKQLNKINIDSIFVFGMKEKKVDLDLMGEDSVNRVKRKNNNYALNWEGTLGFQISLKNKNDFSFLRIKMHGSTDGLLYPHYNLYINNKFIKSGFVGSQDSVYIFKIKKEILYPINQVLIRFDNDNITQKGDRNLYISEIYLDSVRIEKISKSIFFTKKNNLKNFKFNLKLNSIKNYLKDLGYDSSKIRLIEIKEWQSNYNKTLYLAKGARQYFKNINIPNINIITTDTHSRRTYINFKNTIGKKIKVGCIPIKTNKKYKKTLLSNIDERVSLIFTYLYWLF